jgi:hypothetical protein
MKAEDSSSKLVWVEFVVTGALVIVGVSFMKMQSRGCWQGLSLFARKMAEGVILAGFGIAFLFVKWRAGRLAPKNAWEFRSLLFEIAFVIGGAACLVEAFQDR